MLLIKKHKIITQTNETQIMFDFKEKNRRYTMDTSDMSQDELDIWSDINNPNNDSDMDAWSDAHNPNNDDYLGDD